MDILHNEYLIDWQMDKINDICMGGWLMDGMVEWWMNEPHCNISKYLDYHNCWAKWWIYESNIDVIKLIR